MIEVAQIDGDIVLFRSGMACERTEYIVYAVGLEDEGPVREFLYHKDMKEWMKHNSLEDEDVIVDTRHTVEPKNFGFHLAKQTLEKIQERTGARRLNIFLSKSPGYRKMFIPEYKANRKDQRRPYWEDDIREYLVKKWGAVEVDWIEADDAMGIAQVEANERNPDRSVICTNDKDLMMIPGWHYNWTKDYTEPVDGRIPEPNLEYVDSTDGIRFFYKQLIIGDTADNVKGVPKRGPAYADKLLNGIDDEYAMYEAVRGAYIGAFDDEADKQLNYNAAALWILREPDGYWEPPKEVSDDSISE